MAFDPELHELDPKTGFVTDKKLGHLVGIEPMPATPVASADYPKWVVVHDSYVDKKMMGDGPAHISVPEWPEYHVNRANGEVMVLVKDEDEEKRAMADKAPVAAVEEPAAAVEEPMGPKPIVVPGSLRMAEDEEF